MPKDQSICEQFLVAMPSMSDPRFYQSVVYLHHFDDLSANGIIVNKATTTPVKDILDDLSIASIDSPLTQSMVLYGGPVHKELGFVVYPEGEQILVSNSKELLEDVAKQTRNDCLVALGCSAWGAGQLTDELTRNDWLIAPMDKDILFNVPCEERWRAAIESLGISLDQLSEDVGHA